MVFTAERVVKPRLSYFMDCLESRNPPKELKASCETVLESCSIYELMEEKEGPTNISDLDRSMSAFQSTELDQAQDLPMFRERSYELLRNIQGFLWSLSTPRLRDVGRFDPLANVHLPILYGWQTLFLSHRAEVIIRESTALTQLLEEGSKRWKEVLHSPEIEKQIDILRKGLIDMRMLQYAERKLPKKPNARIHRLKVTGIKKRNMIPGLKKITGLMKSRKSRTFYIRHQFKKRQLTAIEPPLTCATINVNGKVPIKFDTQYCEGTEPQWTLDMNVFLDNETDFEVYLYDKKSGLIENSYIRLYRMDDPCDWNSGKYSWSHDKE